MLTKEDINQIGEMMDVKLDAKLDAKFVKFEERIVDRIVGDVGEMIEHNLFPKFDEMDKRFDKIDARIATLPTKEYIDDKLGGLKDVFVMKKNPRPGFLLPQS